MTLYNELPEVVVIAGLSGSGKDTAADYLVDNFGYRRVKFASLLKDMLGLIYRSFGLSELEAERRTDGDLKEVPCCYLGGVSPRFAMQTLGTEWGRNLIDTSLWLRVTMSEIKNSLDDGHPVVITDARFPNEFSEIALHHATAAFVLVERPDVPAMGHSSEQYVLDEDYDIRITNDASVDDLVLTLQAALEDYQCQLYGYETEEEE